MERVNHWTVTERRQYHDDHKRWYRFCICDCGRKRWVNEPELKRGAAKCCSRCVRCRWFIIEGRHMSTRMIADKLGLPIQRIALRLRKGWTISQIITTPVDARKARYKKTKNENL